jgi:hypothetical protein
MRSWTVAAMCVLVLSSPALAQDGLRSASLPERTPQNPIPPQRTDQFLAQPDTYTTRPILPIQLPIGGFFGGFGGGFPESSSPIFALMEQMLGLIERLSERPGEPANEFAPPTVYRRENPAPPPETAVADPPVAAVTPPPPPAVPKTFYVIPGCYAGDRRPTSDRLPAGCDPRRLRVIPPVVATVSRR